MAEKELYNLGDNLKEFILEDHLKNIYEREGINIYKYKTLRFTIDPSGKFKEPCFKVQIGILEAYFTIDNAIKMSGSLGTTDEILIKKWLEFGSNKSQLKMYWLGETIDKSDKIRPFDID